jgi:hypothetical protein
MPTGHNEPYTVGIGQIVGAYQGTHCYDVITDARGRYRASWHHGFTGYPGVRNAGGLQPNTFVLLAFTPGDTDAFIIGPVNVPWAQLASEPSQLITHPQVAGFRLNEGLAGQLYAGNLGNLRNYPSDVADDLVNGEWGIASPNGPGVGVELFRSFVRGGAMSGLWCWGDTQLTRLAGLDFEFMTLAQQDYDRRQGSSLTRSRSRVFYPTEATTDQLPRVLEVAGALHGGLHTYLGPTGARGQTAPRPALFHEYLGSDGNLVIESAGGIHLVRTVSAVLPEESAARVAATGIVGEQPLDADPVREAVATAPRSSLATDQQLPLPWFQHGIDAVQALINKGRGGFDRLPVQWLNLHSTQASFFTTYNKDMWRALPQTVSVTVDAVEKAKTFYLGRSSISLNPDGSILFEDAWHSQILMAGGNILFSAAHDIVFSAGRNLVGLAGNVATLRAEKNVDVSANSGRVLIKAETDLALLGGNGGAGGVLLESKGVNPETTVGTGEAQTVGGVIIKSATGVYADGATIGLNARTTGITITTVGRVQIKAPELILKTTEIVIYTDPTATVPGYFLSQNEMLVPSQLIVAGQVIATGLFADGNILATGSVDATGGSLQVPANQLRPAVRPLQTAVTTLIHETAVFVASEDVALNEVLGLSTPMNPAVETTIGFTFPTSKQLKTDIANAFVLPEARWQTVARRGHHGAFRTWTEHPVTSVAGDTTKTSAFPGYEAWTSPSGYRLHNTDLCFDLATGVALPPLEGAITIVDFDYTALDANFAIGNDL